MTTHNIPSEHELREALKDRVSSAINRCPKSNRKIAEELGVDEGLVSKWANRHNAPREWLLTALPPVLGCDGHWLLTGVGSPERTPHAETALEIIRHVSTASEDGSLDELQEVIRGTEDEPADGAGPREANHEEGNG